jgi:nucleoid DNA-binding protein
MKESKLKLIIKEVAHDLKIEKITVDKVIKELFKEVALTLLIKGRPVMIRRFIKIVFAIRRARKIIRKYKEYETRIK